MSRSLSSREIIELSEEHIAGGVVSLNRKTELPFVFVRGEGAYIYDAEGREYIDYHAAFAPHLLGHHHPEVTAAVRCALESGWSLMGSGPTPWEARLSELLCAAVPSLEKVQLLNTGSEASSLAIRLARAWTGRDDVLLTLGGYNGWHDDVGRAVMPTLEEIGPRRPGEAYPLLPISAGIPESTRQRLHVVGFNDLEAVENVFKKHSIACLITEPVLQNIGVVRPKEGYLEGLRKLCEAYGVVLIFDEVKTGFRSALGGYQEVAGVKPDLSIFGKAVANGYPLGVLGGRADMMALFHHPDAAKRVLVAGTYNGHPLNVAAAIATLEFLARDNRAAYRQLDALGAELDTGLETIFREAGLPISLARNASASCVYFSERLPNDYHDILENHDFALDRRYRSALIEEGIYHFPMPCKQGSISAAHTAADIGRTLEATERVVKRLTR